jgi:chaperonin GroEL
MKKICNLSDPIYKDKLLETLNEVSDTVSSTLGPNGKTCILYNGDVIPHVTKDGVSVAEFIQFNDPFKEAINKIIKETARKTGEKVGDGTTTSILLACKLTEQILQSESNNLRTLEDVETSINEVIRNIRKSKVELDKFDEGTLDTLRSIVHMSSNGDNDITDTIYSILEQIGADGLIDIMESNNELTHVEVLEGMLIEAPAHVSKSTNLNIPYVVLVSNAIEKVHELKTLMMLSAKLLKESGREMIVVAQEFSKEVQDVVTVNNRKGATSMFLVESDGFAYSKYEILDDMAALLDCKILSTDSSSEFGLQNVKLEHLSNNVKSATVTPQHTILQSDKFLTQENEDIKNTIMGEIAELKKTGETKLGEIATLKKRLNKFSKSATIYVGGFTDAEKLEKKDRVEDAVKALESAVNSGVIPGGGFSLYEASRKVSSDIVKSVCEIPGKLLSQNNDVDIFNIYNHGSVMDFATEEVGDAYRIGVLDPADVAIKALQQAMVIVKLLLNTHSIIVPDDEV